MDIFWLFLIESVVQAGHQVILVDCIMFQDIGIADIANEKEVVEAV